MSPTDRVQIMHVVVWMMWTMPGHQRSPQFAHADMHYGENGG